MKVQTTFCVGLERLIEVRVCSPEVRSDWFGDVVGWTREEYERHVAYQAIPNADKYVASMRSREISEEDAISWLYEAAVKVNGHLQIEKVTVGGEMKRVPLENEVQGSDSLTFADGFDQAYRDRIVGQNHVPSYITRAYKRWQMGFGESKPIGSFLFIGDTGVGKTETVKSVADYFFGGKHSMFRIDCSEYQLPHDYANLVGSPKGYTNHSEGGELTNFAMSREQFVVLFDEIEKASLSLRRLLLQITDEGRLTDKLGNTVSFANALVALTSNAGVQQARKGGLGFDASKSKEFMYREGLELYFSPEMLARFTDVVYFNGLGVSEGEEIVRRKFSAFQRKVLDDHGVTISLGDQVIPSFVTKEDLALEGARGAIRKYEHSLEAQVIDVLLSNQAKRGSIVSVDAQNDDLNVQVLDEQEYTSEA